MEDLLLVLAVMESSRCLHDEATLFWSSCISRSVRRSIGLEIDCSTCHVALLILGTDTAAEGMMRASPASDAKRSDRKEDV